MKFKILAACLFTCLTLTQTNATAGIQKATSTYVVDNYAQTKYPILLVHGMFGFNKLGTASFGIDYWYQILPDLAKHGATAYAAQVSALQSTEVRGEQLIQQIEEVSAITGQPKVNLIGHSHGGPTSRYAAGVRPDLVASVTSIAGPNDGTVVVDFIQSNPVLNGVLAIAVDNLIGPVINIAQQSNLPVDFKASINSMTTANSRVFATKFPLGMPTTPCTDGPAKDGGIAFYSWIGNAGLTNILDIDSVFIAFRPLFNGKANDDLASVCSSKLGKTIRDDYQWNHFDEVNQLLGLRGLFSQDPVAVFRQHANRLKLEGL